MDSRLSISREASMQLFFRIFIVSLLSVFVLVGCRGDSPYESDAVATPGDDDNDDDDDDGGGATPLGISYLPLIVFEAYKEFSGADQDNIFQGDAWLYVVPDDEEAEVDDNSDPTVYNAYIDATVINPIDASNLQSITTAAATDYKVTVDGVDIDSSESYPLLQKMIGVESQLVTALVFDLSDSVTGVDINALVTEAKSYVANAKAHSNPLIKNQAFVVWAFARNVEELTDGFSTDTAEINTALDAVVTRYNNRLSDGGVGTVSNLHKAIVEVIGRFEGTVNNLSYNFRGDGDNDLFDTVSNSGVQLSHMVVFSSGPDTYLQFDQNTMIKAIKSQSLLKYDPTSGGSNDTMVSYYKPIFYYVVGGANPGTAYSAISDVAETATNLNLDSGAYDFDAELISNQIAAIDKRIELNNQFLFRFAIVPRIGDHSIVFSSKSTGYNYSLASTFNGSESIANIGSPDMVLPTLVEITGASGEYICNRTIELSEENTFAPATRWTAEVYDSGDYSWSITDGAGSTNSNGTFTVTSVMGEAARLTLTNTVLGHSTYIYVTN